MKTPTDTVRFDLDSEAAFTGTFVWHIFLALTIGAAAIWFFVYWGDDQTFQFFATHRLPGELRRAIKFSEVFAHGTGVFAILLVLWSLRLSEWRGILRVAACAFGSGMAANVVKLVVARYRPHSIDDLSINAIDSFQRIGLTTFGDLIADNARAVQSFPSAHTATAFGFALGLSWYFGRGRAVFMALACTAAIQRLVTGAHWPSDVIAGALVAFVTVMVGAAISTPAASVLSANDRDHCDAHR